MEDKVTIKSNVGMHITMDYEDLDILKRRYFEAKLAGAEENQEIVVEINGIKKEFKFSDFGL